MSIVDVSPHCHDAREARAVRIRALHPRVLHELLQVSGSGVHQCIKEKVSAIFEPMGKNWNGFAEAVTSVEKQPSPESHIVESTVVIAQFEPSANNGS